MYQHQLVIVFLFILITDYIDPRQLMMLFSVSFLRVRAESISNHILPLSGGNGPQPEWNRIREGLICKGWTADWIVDSSVLQSAFDGLQ